MKSIEEKAKAYDKVREKIAIRFGSNVAEEIFSEFEESEDERIRKSIINLVIKSAQNGGMALHKWESQQMIAYLEKQGEQKSEEVDNLHNYLYGEQKPAWSEEDEKMYRGLHNLIYSTSYCDSRKEFSDFLNSLKDRVRLQPKQEWSEEDEKCIRLSTDIIDSALRAGFCVQLDRDRCVDWLKSLRPQNHWKPSDEQMGVIEAVINNRSYQRRHLDSLYKQLKKLRE